MRVLGIDLDSSVYTLCLSEGFQARWPPVEVDNSCAPSAELDARVIRRDLARFVGHPEPEIHRTVLAASSGAETHFRGLGDFTTISIGQAALLAAMCDPTLPNVVRERVDIIVVRERAVEVHGFRLDGRRRIVACAPVSTMAAIGHAIWIGEVVGRVMERLADTRTREVVAADLVSGAAEVGARLRDVATDDNVIIWNGLHKELLSSRVEFSLRACARWVSVQELSQAIPEALSRCARDLGGSGAILIAGIGATWPFAASIARHVGAVYTLAEPRLAVARGASYWFMRREEFLSTVLLEEDAPLQRLVTSVADGASLDFERLAQIAATGRSKT